MLVQATTNTCSCIFSCLLGSAAVGVGLLHDGDGLVLNGTGSLEVVRLEDLGELGGAEEATAVFVVELEDEDVGLHRRRPWATTSVAISEHHLPGPVSDPGIAKCCHRAPRSALL